MRPASNFVIRRILHGGGPVEMFEYLQRRIDNVCARQGGRFGAVLQLAGNSGRERARVVNWRFAVSNCPQNTHKKLITAEWPHISGGTANN